MALKGLNETTKITVITVSTHTNIIKLYMYIHTWKTSCTSFLMPSSSFTRRIIFTQISGILVKSGHSKHISFNILITRFLTLTPVSCREREREREKKEPLMQFLNKTYPIIHYLVSFEHCSQPFIILRNSCYNHPLSGIL